MRRISPFCYHLFSGSCTIGSAGGGVRVECATTKAAAFARARRWRTLRLSFAGKVRSPSSFSFQLARAAFTSASVGCKPSRSATSKSPSQLRSWLGLLLVAEREGLQPTEAEVNAALANWNEKLDGERTFPANDSRKVRQRLARANAAAFVVAHSTLTPPPAEPIVQEPENK